MRAAPVSAYHAASPATATGVAHRSIPRRVPSPTNIWSIDRHDSENVTAEDTRSAASPPVRQPSMHHVRGSRQTPATHRRAAHGEAYYFFDPEWTAVEEGDNGSLLSSSPISASGLRDLQRYDVPSVRSAPQRQQRGTPSQRTSSQPSGSGKVVDESARAPQRHASHGQRAVSTAIADASLAQPSRDTDSRHGSENESNTQDHGGSRQHYKRLLKRYEEYIERELKPQLSSVSAALREKQRECDQLHADNVVLTQQLSRQLLLTTSSQAPPMSSTLRPASAAAMPPQVASPPPQQSLARTADDAVQRQLREVTAEAELLRRQLAKLQQQTAAARMASENATLATDAAAASPAPLAETPTAKAAAAALRAQVLRLCRVIAEDGLGFTEALADLHERHQTHAQQHYHHHHLTPQSPSAISSSSNVKDMATAGAAVALRRAASPSRAAASNPLRAAVEQWGRFAAMTHPSATATAAAQLPSTHSSSSPAGPSPGDLCATLLQALITTLQTEHAAVAEGMEGVRQVEQRAMESVARHQRVVEQVRSDAERRMEELEADHDAEVQTLQNAIAELEQQVSMTAASRRPWTAGLLIHRNGFDGQTPLGAATSMAANASSNSRILRSSSPAAATAGGGNSGGASSSRVHSAARETGESFDAGKRTAGVGDSRSAVAPPPPPPRVDADTQTVLSLEVIHAALQKAREEPLRPVRREREAELVELMASEIESLRNQLMDSRAVTVRLREEQRRFLGDVTMPLSYFDSFSSFPAFV